MLSMADLVGRAGSLLIMGGGIMETLLSHVSHIRDDLVSINIILLPIPVTIVSMAGT